MWRSKIIFIWLVFNVGKVGANCQDIDGSFYYGGQGIWEVNLKSGKKHLVFDMPNSLVSSFSKLSNNKFIINVQDLNKPVAPRKIVIFDREKSKLEEVTTGSLPVYIASHNKIIFYRNKQLFIADVNNPNESIKSIINISNVILKPVVQVSDNEVVFEDKYKSLYGIWHYNVVSNELKWLPNLGDCALDNAFWRGRTNQISCVERTQNGVYTGGKYLVELDGTNKYEFTVNLDTSWWPVSYQNDQDCILLQERTTALLKLREIHPVWIYDFQSGNRHKILDNTLLGTSGVLIQKNEIFLGSPY